MRSFLGLVSASQKLVLLATGFIPLLYIIRGGVIVSTTARKTIFLFICILSLIAVYQFISPPALRAAQAVTFLTPPYFGTKTLNAVFDHEYPTRFTQMTPPDIDGSVVNRDGFTHTTGDCSRYSGHAGIDYGVTYDYVLTTHDGVVTEAGWSNPANRRDGLGLRVEIQTTGPGDIYRTRYGHLSGLVVQKMQTVVQQEIIGMSGHTGNSTDPHLHFEVQKRHVHQNGNVRFYPVNPYGWASVNPQRLNDPWENAEDGRPASVNLWQNRPSISTELCSYASGTPLPPSDKPPFTPDLDNPVHRVIDDTDGRFSHDIPWVHVPDCAAGECYGGTYWWLRRTSSFPNYSATWQLYVHDLAVGSYDVYAYIPSAHSNSAEAYYQIHHNSKLHSARIAQSEFHKPDRPRTWAYLGRYDFSDGINVLQPQRIVVYHNGDVGQDVAADAIALVLADGPPDLNLPIAVGSDDAGRNASTGCGFSTAHNEIYLGRCASGANLVSGFRYGNVALPANATITRAHLLLTVDGTYTQTLRLRFYGEPNPNSPTFSSNNRPEDRPLTNAWSYWYVPSADEWKWVPLLPQTRYSPNVGPVVQEIVNHFAWLPGKSLTFIVKPAPDFSGNVYRRVIAYERPYFPPGTHAARLLVWYDE